MATLSVSGFTGHLLALNGSYTQQADNHGKPTYKKHAEKDGTTQCCVYYWDERDGEALSGWWMAPEVGGEQVWSHCVSRNPTPPTRGWKVPWHTQTPDNRVVLELKPAGAMGGGMQQGGYGQQKRGFEPPQHQQHQQHQEQNKFARTNQYGQQGDKGHQKGGHVQQGNAQKGGHVQQGSYGGSQQHGQQHHQQNQYSKPEMGGKGGGYGQHQQQQTQAQQRYGQGGYGQYNQQQQNQQQAQHEVRQKQQKEHKLNQLNTQITTAETAMAKLTGKEAEEPNFDKNRAMQGAKNAISGAQRSIDTHVKSGGLDEASVSTQRQKLKKLETDLNKFEESLKKQQQAKLEQIKTSYVSELTALVVESEKRVEKSKDAAVLFTCEMAEHIKPEETMAAKEKTDAEANPATESIKKCKDLMQQKEKEFRVFPAAEVEPIRASVKPLQTRLQTAEKELVALKNQAMTAVRKAQQQLAKEKREREQEEAKKERERVQTWNRELVSFAFQINLVGEEIARSKSDEKDADTLKALEAKLRGLKNEMKKRSEMKECQPQSKSKAQQTMSRLDQHLKKIGAIVKELDDKNQDAVRRAGILVAAALRKKVADSDLDTVFASVTLNTNKLDKGKFERMVKNLDVVEDAASVAVPMFKEVCKSTGLELTVLDKDAFSLHVVNAYHSVVKATSLTAEQCPKSAKISTLEVESVVQVLEGPVEVEGAMRVRLSIENKTGTAEEGWATLRYNGEDLLAKYSPHYTVLSETVLTNTFALKGFKVVRRIKADEKFRAIGIPVYNKESDMWRINGITDEKENVWVTIVGNRGTSLLRNNPISVLSAAAQKEAEAEEFSEERLNDMLSTMADEAKTKMEKEIKGVAEAVTAINVKLAALEKQDEEGQEPTNEEVSTTCKEADEAFKEYETKYHAVQRNINLMHQNLRQVETGPYAEVKKTYGEFGEQLREQDKEVKELMQKKRTVSQSVRNKENERRLAKEKKEQEDQANALMEQLPPKQEQLEALQTRLKATQEVDQPRLVDSIGEYQNKIKKVEQELDALKIAFNELISWTTEVTPQVPRGALIKPVGEIKKLKNNATNALRGVEEGHKRLKNYQNEFKEKIRVDFAVTLTKTMEKKELNAQKLFDMLKKDADTLSLEKFDAFAKKLVKGLEDTEELVRAALGPIKELTADHLDALSRTNYRCLKRALITDIVDIKTCKRLKTIEKEELVQVVEKHVICPETGLTRFKARSDDGMEGYVTIRGNKNSHYLTFQQSWYKVVKETVLTDLFEMKDFKALRRLKPGDYVRELTMPNVEEKSQLMRMKAQTLDDNTIGWVTIKGNHGSQFLVNTDLPADMEFGKKDAKSEEQTTATEAKEEEMEKQVNEEAPEEAASAEAASN